MNFKREKQAYQLLNRHLKCCNETADELLLGCKQSVMDASMDYLTNAMDL